MKNKITPAPWVAIGANVYGNNLRSILPANGADRALIESAPELLSALEQLERACTDEGVKGMDGLLALARVVIAKATGEQL